MNVSRFKKWLIPLLAIAALMLAARQLGVFSSQTAASASLTKPAATVTTAETGFVVKKPKLLLTGSIEGETSVIISPKIAGRIERVSVQDGQKISAGQELVMLESVELGNSVRMNTDTVNKASANYDNLKADYNRYKTLYEQSAVSRQQLDSMETRLRVAETELSSAYASLNNSQQQYAYACIAAPVAGVVANKSATIGQVVAAGQQLMTLESIEQVYAVINIEQKDMGVINPGMAAEITVDSYPGQTFSGKVHIINPAAATSNRMFRTKILIDNADQRLKPGMFVKAAIVTGADTRALAVPRPAVFQKQGLYYVFTLEDGRAKRRQIEIGDIVGDFIEVKTGLSEKTTVITSNTANLKDGDSVTAAK